MKTEKVKEPSSGETIASVADDKDLDAESAELSDSTTDRSALIRHSGRKNKCFHKKPTKQGFSKKPS